MIKQFDEILKHSLDECEKRDGSDSLHELVGHSWRKCRPGIIRRVDFALYSANVELVECLDYFNGRIYHVREPETGRFDFVGSEYLKVPNDGSDFRCK